jgi:hypothetical protein
LCLQRRTSNSRNVAADNSEKQINGGDKTAEASRKQKTLDWDSSCLRWKVQPFVRCSYNTPTPTSIGSTDLLVHNQALFLFALGDCGFCSPGGIRTYSLSVLTAERSYRRTFNEPRINAMLSAIPLDNIYAYGSRLRRLATRSGPSRVETDCRSAPRWRTSRSLQYAKSVCRKNRTRCLVRSLPRLRPGRPELVEQAYPSR